jgi:hypothetical protein
MAVTRFMLSAWLVTAMMSSALTAWCAASSGFCKIHVGRAPVLGLDLVKLAQGAEEHALCVAVPMQPQQPGTTVGGQLRLAERADTLPRRVRHRCRHLHLGRLNCPLEP